MYDFVLSINLVFNFFTPDNSISKKFTFLNITHLKQYHEKFLENTKEIIGNLDNYETIYIIEKICNDIMELISKVNYIYTETQNNIYNQEQNYKDFKEICVILSKKFKELTINKIMGIINSLNYYIPKITRLEEIINMLTNPNENNGN